MFVDSHLGKGYITQLGTNEYRVELVNRRVIAYGDEIRFADGRLYLSEHGCTALILDDVRLIPASQEDIKRTFATRLDVAK